MSEVETTNEVSSTADTGSGQTGKGNSPVLTVTSQNSLSQSSPAGEGVEAGAASSPAWSPNFKYKVYDQEKEFHKALHPVIKDAETEKMIRELYEKADGLDTVKPRFHKVREEYKSLQDEYTGLQQTISGLGDMIRKGDLDNFFSAIELNPTKVFQWVLDKLNYNQLPPEQRQILDAKKQAEQQAMLYEQQNSQLQTQYQQALVQSRTVELETALTQPNVRAIADSFDARLGRPGAFKEQVINQGKLAWYSQGKDIPVMEAVSAVADMASKFIQTGQTNGIAPQAVGDAMGQATAGMNTRQSPPVIPNVAGKSNSPARKVVKSIDQLRELANQMS